MKKQTTESTTKKWQSNVEMNFTVNALSAHQRLLANEALHNAYKALLRIHGVVEGIFSVNGK